MDAGRFLEVAAQVTAKTDGMVMSVAAVDVRGHEHALTVGAADGALLQSCSSFKPIVAAAVRSAAADGALPLDEPVGGLPGGEAVPAGRWDATLEALLGHVSGLAGDLYAVPVTGGSDEEAAAALLARFLPAVPRTAPGRFWYSNLGYVLAGLVLARAEGDGLLAVVRRRVLEPAGAAATTDPGGAVPPSCGGADPPNGSLRAGGGGIHLRALDLARVGAALAGGALRGLATAAEPPVAVVAAADQHPAGGFFVDDRYGRRLLAHGGGNGAYGSSWFVDPEGGWSAAALFNHPAGYGLDVAAALAGRARGDDPTPRTRRRPAAGWYLNAYAGLVEVRDGAVAAANGRPVLARCGHDGAGVAVNRASIVIGSLPFEPAGRPEARPDPVLAGTWTSGLDELIVALDPAPTVRSARRGESPAVALAPGTLACDHGELELRGDELVAGGAYPFARG